MDRLTIRNSDGSVSQPTNSTFEEVFNRLAEYEDIGLSPEEIEVRLGRFSAFLYYATKGKMIATNHSLKAMMSYADAWCNECEDRQFSEKYKKAEAERAVKGEQDA